MIYLKSPASLALSMNVRILRSQRIASAKVVFRCWIIQAKEILNHLILLQLGVDDPDLVCEDTSNCTSKKKCCPDPSFFYWYNNNRFFSALCVHSHSKSVTEYSQARCLPKEIACDSDLLRLMTDCRNSPSEFYNVSDSRSISFQIFIEYLLQRRARRRFLRCRWSLLGARYDRQG